MNPPAGTPRWRSAAIVSVSGVLGAVAASLGFRTDSAWLFYAGVLALAAALGPLAFWAGRRRWPAPLLATSVGAGIALALLLVVDLGYRARAALQADAPPTQPFLTYAEARADPDAFRRWWNGHVARFLDLAIFERDPRGEDPFVLAPGATDRFHGSTIRINTDGFRGVELARPKGAEFRIVVLGESTTFGVTMLPSDRPWPEVLESLIAERLDCDAPVRVVNGGVPGWTLANQLRRLDREVLPLEPDLLVSYHGYNGFHFFFRNLSEVVVEDPGLSIPRPSPLLAALESALNRWRLRRRFERDAGREPATLDVDLEASAYYALYQALVDRGRDAGIPVALSTFNMAIDAGTPEEVVRFYEEAFPDARSRVVGNALHNRMIGLLARRGDVVLVDARSGLNGAYRDYYTDIVHFNQRGRDRMAENVLDGLDAFLADHPRLRCRPSARRRQGGLPSASSASGASTSNPPIDSTRR